jgi:hypothetical protein
LDAFRRRNGRIGSAQVGPHGEEGATRRFWGALLGLALLMGLALACNDDPAESPEASPSVPPRATGHDRLPHRGPVSADAHAEVTDSLKLDLETPRHASDGGGRAWIETAWEMQDDQSFAPARRNEAGEPVLRAAHPGRFQLVYEVGPLGIAAGGFVFLQVSPFWEWDDPQTRMEDAPGYTRVSTTAEAVTLDAFFAASQLLAIEIGGRALVEGERIEIVYGAGPAGARVDRYAERRSRLWIAVDGDGDGVRGLLDASPTVDVRANDPVRLVLTLPSTAEPGDPVRVTLALLDHKGNAGAPFEGRIALEGHDGLELPDEVSLAPSDAGRTSLLGRATRAGIFRLRARVDTPDGAIESESNPLVVREGIRLVLWGDLHGHSQLSDGTGTPDDFYRYARDVAGLDVAALTDHDHWGMRFLDANPSMWQEIRDAAARHHEPGRFVTLLGYEWTSWIQGHRHVLYFQDEGEVLSSLDPRYERPDQLWAALAGKPALTFAHHSAGGPVSTNWTFAPPPEIEPVTEIASVHGSSEALDSPSSIYSPVPGNFVRDVLRIGYRFGFIGSSDSHDGHPGLAGIAAGSPSGTAAIRARERTRESVLEALRARDTYATNGPRIHLEVSLARGSDEATSTLRYRTAGTAPIERIDFVRSGLMASVAGDGERDLEGERTIPKLAPGEFLYLRVVQTDGGVAWSSPFYGEAPEEPRTPG